MVNIFTFLTGKSDVVTSASMKASKLVISIFNIPDYVINFALIVISIHYILFLYKKMKK